MTQEYREDTLDNSMGSTSSWQSSGDRGSLDGMAEKKSIVAQMKANLEGSKSSGLVHTIDDFYRQQKAEKVGESRRKHEAATSLHHFRGTAADLNTAPRKTPIRNPVNPAAGGAANRAAAAVFLGSTPTSPPGTSSNDVDSKQQGTASVRSLVDFYRIQRELRLKDSASRKKSADFNHQYNNLVARMEPMDMIQIVKSVELATSSQELLNRVAEKAKEDADEKKESDDDAVLLENIENPVVAVDYKAADYRGFVFVVHENHGLMLLHCTRKAKKGPHHQLPGGHIDENEFLAAASLSEHAGSQLLLAARMGAARELFEETGVDVRDSLDRLTPAVLRNVNTENGDLELTCELKKRLYFFLPVTDDDFVFSESSTDPSKLAAPMTGEGNHLRLKLSVEHSGFLFEREPKRSAKLLQHHSGGVGSKALFMAMTRNAREAGTPTNEDDKSGIDQREAESEPTEIARIENPVVAVDYKKADYRSFVFIVHEKFGLMLLHCTRKAKKGPHYQLAGGHIDEPEFLEAARTSNDAHAQLMIAAQMGAARELYEETGLDVRDKLYRLEPAALRSEILTDKKGKLALTCELKKRLYFFLPVSDEDFISPESVEDPSKLCGPLTEVGGHLRLQLSMEHSGFMFEKDPETAAKMIEQHSGGNGSRALRLATRQDDYELDDCKETSSSSMDKISVKHGESAQVKARSLLPSLKRESSLNYEELPSDLLPPPKRENIFTCCFCVDF